MSHVDSIDNEHVGFFAGLPIYHPLADLEGDPLHPIDFSCTPHNLVIGGGSGEHLGIVLLRPDCAVAWFLINWSDELGEKELQRRFEGTGTSDMAWDDHLSEYTDIPKEKIFHFAGWSLADYHSFYERCASPALCRPYTKSEGFFEQWLAASLGEFIFFAMPELASNLLKQLSLPNTAIWEVRYLNVLLPPPGYPSVFGRKIIDGKVVWGNVRWQT